MPSRQSHSTESNAKHTCTSAKILCRIPDFCCSSRSQPCQLTHILDCQAAATKEVGKILARTQSHADALRESADQLYYLNQELQSCCVPALDVHTAWQVLETGTGCSGHHLCKISPQQLAYPAASGAQKAACATLVPNAEARTALLLYQLPVRHWLCKMSSLL